jgi:hypothetical protein
MVPGWSPVPQSMHRPGVDVTGFRFSQRTMQLWNASASASLRGSPLSYSATAARSSNRVRHSPAAHPLDPRWAANGPSLQLWDKFIREIYKMMWGAKFDRNVPELAKRWAVFPRTNILSHIEKLARATKEPVQEDYQWLCNTVHPSVGGWLLLHQCWGMLPGPTPSNGCVPRLPTLNHPQNRCRNGPYKMRWREQPLWQFRFLRRRSTTH